LNNETLEKLETQIAYLERTTAELSNVVFRQHQDIQNLRAQMLSLATRIDAMRVETDTRTPEQERPPHY
jgi:uncharacterized coiled-coil protein SlyX